mgnify:CR=1 FL=1
MGKILNRWAERRDWFDLDFPPEIEKANAEEAWYHYTNEMRDRFPNATPFAIWAVTSIWWNWNTLESYAIFARYVLTGRGPDWWNNIEPGEYYS